MKSLFYLHQAVQRLKWSMGPRFLLVDQSSFYNTFPSRLWSLFLKTVCLLWRNQPTVENKIKLHTSEIEGAWKQCIQIFTRTLHSDYPFKWIRKKKNRISFWNNNLFQSNRLHKISHNNAKIILNFWIFSPELNCTYGVYANIVTQSLNVHKYYFFLYVN